MNQHRSVSVGGSVTGSVIQTGDQNTASLQCQQASLPPADDVDIHIELASLKDLLATLETTDRRKIDNAIADAEDELQKPQPDKDEAGQALDRALSYAQKSQGFVESIDKLRPHVEKATACLGANWYKLLPIVGLAI